MKQAFAFAQESHRSKCTRILQLFYHFIQMLVRIFTKSLKASLKAPPYFENIQQQRNRKQITALEQVHRSQLQATLYLPSGLNSLSLFTINSPFELHRWKGMDYLQGTFIKHNYKKMKFCQRSWSGRTQNTTHLGCAMWFTTANFINHKKTSEHHQDSILHNYMFDGVEK